MIFKLIKYSKHISLKVLVLEIVLEIVMYFLDGYFFWDWDFSFILFIMFSIRIFLVMSVFIQIIQTIISRSYKWKYTILCLLLASISMVPKGHYSTLGKIAYVYNADPTSVLVEVRKMMDIHEPLTHFGRPHRFPLNNPFPLNEIPQKVKIFHKGEVLVLENTVLLGMGDLIPAFSGFVVFREGFDPWADQKQIALQDFWFVSWKIRIIDGLYWYKVNGCENPFIEEIYQLDNYVCE